MTGFTGSPLSDSLPPSTAPDLSLIASDMLEVDKAIKNRLQSDAVLISQVSQHIFAAGGKRLRPAILLLLCGAMKCQHPQRFNLAAVVEFIHTATLLHDDVVDDSSLRRGRVTANQSFGNPASVLVGDFLYSRAFQMMVESGQMRVMEILSEATNTIAEGEVLQLMNTHNASLDEEGYLLVIRSKTAKLFEASARLAAVLAQTNKELENSCATYGQALGVAFQIIDDVLDYDGDVSQLGKNLGADLREGKTTLPLIIAMLSANRTESLLIRKAIETGGLDQLDSIIAIVRKTGSLAAARSVAASEAQRAINALNSLNNGPYKEVLLQLASQLLSRSS